MFKSIFSILTVLLIFLCLPGMVAPANISQKVFVIHVHSYDIQHPCTYPQMVGFNDTLGKLRSRGFEIKQKAYYLNAKTGNVTPESQKHVASIILGYIKSTKPDYVYVTDDLAFELVGIPALNMGYKVLASGMNKQIQSYVIDKQISQDALKNLYACEEYIHLDDVFFIMENIKFKPFKWYILYDDTETSYYMAQNYEKELIGKAGVTPIQIGSVADLEDFLDNIKTQDRSVLILTLQSIYAKGSKTKKVDKSEFMSVFFNNNKKHLELSANLLFSKFGSAISSGPDFEDMGIKCANYLIDQVIPKGWKPDITQPVTRTAVNKQRLKELKFDKIMDVDTRQIKIFDSYAIDK